MYEKEVGILRQVRVVIDTEETGFICSALDIIAARSPDLAVCACMMARDLQDEMRGHTTLPGFMESCCENKQIRDYIFGQRQARDYEIYKRVRIAYLNWAIATYEKGVQPVLADWTPTVEAMQ